MSRIIHKLLLNLSGRTPVCTHLTFKTVAAQNRLNTVFYK